MMPPRLAVVVLVLLTIGCDRGGGTNSISGPDALRQRTRAAETDIAGAWKITGLWPEYPIFGAYGWDLDSAPLSITFRPDALVFESPCRRCTSARRLISGGMLLDTPACERRACHEDESERAEVDLVAGCLQGFVSATYEAQSFPQRTQSLQLYTSGGELLLERQVVSTE